MKLAPIGVVSFVLSLLVGCRVSGSDLDEIEGELSAIEDTGTARTDRSEVQGCHFFVDSNYGGEPLTMRRGTTISNLRDHEMNDKISSVYLRGGATARMWIHRNYDGRDWFISSDVPTFHTSRWGNLGDNSSSIDCY